MSRRGGYVAIVATVLVVASCGGGDSAGSDASDAQVVERVAAACELLTSDAIVEQYAALMGSPVEPIGECVSVRPGTRQLATANTVGSGFVPDSTFAAVEANDHRLRLVGFYVPWIETINGVAAPGDLREAFPDDEVTDETTGAGNPYQLIRSVDDLRLAVDGLMLTFDRGVVDEDSAIDEPVWPPIFDGDDLVDDLRPLVDAIVDELTTD